jgi:hypothetical protein
MPTRCPECSYLSGSAVRPGTKVRCPECGHTFRTGAEPAIYRGTSNVGLPGAVAISREALLASRTQKERLIGGRKQPVFGDQRKFLAICLSVCLAALV